MRGFLTELKRRKVYRVAVVYAAAAWLLLEVADLVSPHLGLPQWTVTLVLLLCALGFPLALILAWAFELTPDGVVRTAPAAADTSSPLPASRIAELVAIGLLVVLVGYLYLDRLSEQETRAEQAELGADIALASDHYRSIAVLPFVDMSEAGNQSWFAEGIAEELLIALSRVDELKVMARTSSFAFKNTDKTIADIAHILGVQAVVEGTVRRSGDRVRITAQLVDASGGYRVWSGSYERQLTDIFQLQDELARALLQALRVELGLDAGERLVPEQTRSPAAHAWLIRGRALLDPGNPDNLYRSITFFEKAVETDPDYATAWGALATAHSLTVLWQPAESATTPTTLAYDRALELDPNQSEALAAKALLTLLLQRDWETAGRLYRRAMASRSRASGSYATTLGTTGYALFWLVPLEQTSAAVRLYTEAEKLDPLHAGTKAAFASVLLWQGDAQAAILKAREALELNPQHFFAVTTLSTAYRMAGNCPAAFEFLDTLPIQMQQQPRVRIQVALCEAAQGEFARARSTYAELEQTIPAYDGLAATVELALSLGETERAIDLMERLVELNAWEQLFLRVSYRHRELLKDHPRYLALLKRIGLDDDSVTALNRQTFRDSTGLIDHADQDTRSATDQLPGLPLRAKPPTSSIIEPKQGVRVLESKGSESLKPAPRMKPMSKASEPLTTLTPCSWRKYGNLYRVRYRRVLDGRESVFRAVAAAAAHVFQVGRRVDYLADVISHHNAAWPEQAALLDQLQVAFVEVFPVVQEDQVEEALEVTDQLG